MLRTYRHVLVKPSRCIPCGACNCTHLLAALDDFLVLLYHLDTIQIGMLAVLPLLGRSGRASSTSTIAARCISISFGLGYGRPPNHVILPSQGGVKSPWKWLQQTRASSSAQKAKELNQQSMDEELSEFEDNVDAEREKQVRTPWQREGADQQPVSRPRSASAVTKGRMGIYSVE